MKKQIATVVLSSTLLLTGCANWCDECADGACDVVTTKVVLPTSTLFAFDSAQLTVADNDALNDVIERLKAEPQWDVSDSLDLADRGLFLPYLYLLRLFQTSPPGKRSSENRRRLGM